MIRRPPRSTQSRSSAASDVYKRQVHVPPPLSAIAPDFRTPRGWTQIPAGCHAMQCPSEQSSVRVVVHVRPGYHEPIAAQNTSDRTRPTLSLIHISEPTRL